LGRHFNFCSQTGITRLYGRGAEAAEAILGSLFRVDVSKALDPLDADDFLVIVDRLASELRGATRAEEAAAMQRALQRLDVDWANLSPAGRSSVVRAARQALAPVPDRVLPRLDHVFEARANSVVKDSRRATVRRFELHIGADLSATDERIARFVRESQANFVRDEYGRRQERFSQRARQIVADGLERGLGQADIVDELSTTLPAEGLRQSRAYWDVVSMAFSNRARTLTQVSAFEEARIEQFRFEAILDRVTSRVCRFMHGKVFSVARALDRFRKVESARDPEEIRDLQPFIRVGLNPEGRQTLFYEKSGKRHLIAEVDEASDENDATGSFSRSLSTNRLEAAGISLPPLHGRCRSTVLAV
jgi:SPP1 gp7 family putative phage head morphogenesis protein